MTLIDDILSMQKCGGVIILNDDEHIEVDKVLGVKYLFDTPWVDYTAKEETYTLSLKNIKEARPLSLDYELPYPRGKDEDNCDKDGEEFELIDTDNFVNKEIIEEPTESKEPKDEEKIDKIEHDMHESTETNECEEKDETSNESNDKVSFSNREDYTPSFDVYEDKHKELISFNNYKVLDSCYKCGYDIMLSTETTLEKRYKIVYMCEHTNTHFIILDDYTVKSHVLLPEVKTVYPAISRDPALSKKEENEYSIPSSYFTKETYDLPVIIEPLTPPLIEKTRYSINDKELIELIKGYLSSNKCFGLMIDDDVVFNTFKKFTMKDKFKLDSERLTKIDLSNNVNTLLSLMIDNSVTQPTNTFIYMDTTAPYMMKLTYYPSSKTFIVTFFQSTKYKEQMNEISAEETYTEMIHEFNKNKGKTVTFMYKDELKTIEVSKATKKFVEGYCFTEKEYITFDIDYIHDLKTQPQPKANDLTEFDIINAINVLSFDNKKPVHLLIIKQYLKDKNKELNDFCKLMVRLLRNKQIFEDKDKYLTVPPFFNRLKECISFNLPIGIEYNGNREYISPMKLVKTPTGYLLKSRRREYIINHITNVFEV